MTLKNITERIIKTISFVFVAVVLLLGLSASAQGTVSGVTLAPVISSISPASGVVGSKVTITGSNLSALIYFKFGTGAVTNFTPNGAGTSVTFTVPEVTAPYCAPGVTPCPAGAVNITPGSYYVAAVDNQARTSNSKSFVVTLPPAPVISSLSPSYGPVGTIVTINGANLSTVTRLNFGNGGDTAVTPAADGLSAKFTVPSGAAPYCAPGATSCLSGAFLVTPGNYSVSVVNGLGQVSVARNFTVTLPPAPVVTSIAPTSGSIGSAITITGSNFSGASEVIFYSSTGQRVASLVSPAISAVTANSLVMTLISSFISNVKPGTYQIKVVTPAGTSTAKYFTLTLPPAPAITSITPASSPVGTSVIITGTNLSSVSRINFGTGVVQPAETFAVNDTSLRFVIPASTVPYCTPGLLCGVQPTLVTPGTYSVSVVDGQNRTSAGKSFTVTPSPVPGISAISPLSGQAGTMVTITGTNLSDTKYIKLGTGSISTFNPNNTGTSISFFVPSMIVPYCPSGTICTPSPAWFTAGTYALSVVDNQNRESNGVNFTFVSTPQTAPVITSISPTSGSVGTLVTVTGTGFESVSRMNFGNNAADIYNPHTSTSVTFSIPASFLGTALALGTYPVSVTVGGENTQTSNAVNFTVTASLVPVITSISPLSGSVGTTVTIVGTGLSNVTRINFGTGASIPATPNSAGNSVSFTIPSLLQPYCPPGAYCVQSMISTTVGTYAVSVEDAQRRTSNAVNFSVIAPVPAPVLTNITPLSGAVGTTVTLTGTNLQNVTRINFGTGSSVSATPNTAGTSIVFVVPSLLQPYCPPGAYCVQSMIPTTAGSYAVSVVDNQNRTSNVKTFTVTLPPAPVISSISPISGTVGTTVTITGTNLQNVGYLKFGRTGAITTFTNNGDTSISFVVPAHTIPYCAPDLLCGVQPTSVTPGAYSLSLFDKQERTSAAKSFTVISSPAPVITSITPTSGPDGAAVTITGTNLSTITRLNFGNGNISGFTPNSAGTSISFTIPRTIALNCNTGTTCPAGSLLVSAGTYPVSVVDNQNRTSNAINFTVTFTPLPPAIIPVITGISPLSGSVGSMITITGINLRTAARVNFGVGSTAVSSASENSVAFVVPLSITPPCTTTASCSQSPISIVPGAYAVSVTDIAGQTSSSINFIVATSAATPVITSVTPLVGSIGTTVTIFGTGLSNIARIKFGSGVVQQVESLLPSDTSATFIIPTNLMPYCSTSMCSQIAFATALGVYPVSVVDVLGRLSNSIDFSVIAPVPAPVITSISPTSGVVGSIAVISGTNLSTVTRINFGTGSSVPATPDSAGNSVSFTIPSLLRPYCPPGVYCVQSMIPTTAGSYAVSVVDNQNRTSNAKTFTVTLPPAPAISSISPTSGLVGSTVTITGANLSSVSRVNFGNGSIQGVAAANGTSVVFTIPSRWIPYCAPGLVCGVQPTVTTPGTYSVSVVDNLNRTSNAKNLVVTSSPAPVITSISPLTGPTGTTAIITGTNLWSVTRINFSTGNIGSFTPNDSGTSITFTIPAGVAPYCAPGATSCPAGAFLVSPGGYPVSVVDNQNRTSNSVSFIVTASPVSAPSGTPVITSISPLSGPIGASITINGINLSTVSRINFGVGVLDRIVSVRGESVVFVVPENLASLCSSASCPSNSITPGTYPVSVVDREGRTSSSVSFTVTGAMTAAVPVIAGLTPMSGPVGSTVTIVGTGLSRVSSINFGTGTAQRTESLLLSDTSLTFFVPSSITPASCSTGTTCLQTAVLVAPGSYLVSVKTDEGRTSNAINFTVNTPTPASESHGPVIRGILPLSGSVGTTVTLTGTGLSTVTRIGFGNGNVLGVVASNDTSVNFIVPEKITPACAVNTACIQTVVPVFSGIYPVSVTDSQGRKSNVTSFVVGATSTAVPFGGIGSTNTGTCALLKQSFGITARDARFGKEVSLLQKYLKALNHLNSEPTGYYGTLTRQAVRAFQTANGISSTGYVGPLTRAKINLDICSKI